MWKTFCMSEQKAFSLLRGNWKLKASAVPDSESWQSPVCWTDSGPLDMSRRLRQAFTFSFISFILGGLAFNLTDWANRSSCRLAISTDAQKLSVKKGLFNNIAVTAYAQGPVGHYRTITSEILVWTSGGKLMCYSDERFSLWGLQQELNRGGEDRINCKLS